VKNLLAIQIIVSLAGVVACGVERTDPRDPEGSDFPAAVTSGEVRTESPLTRGIEASAPANVCKESLTDVCGPFSAELVGLCVAFSPRTQSAEAVCHGSRWSRAFQGDLKRRLGDRGTPSGSAAFLARYKTNYVSIKRLVEVERGLTSNGCAAFLSSALFQFGLPVTYETWAPRLVDTLERRHGFARIGSHTALLPGDVVVTRDAQTNQDGLTPHVFVFVRYRILRYGAGVAEAVALDNQGNSYARNLVPGSKSHFWYALRMPR